MASVSCVINSAVNSIDTFDRIIPTISKPIFRVVSGVVTFNGHQIRINSTDTLETVAEKINAINAPDLSADVINGDCKYRIAITTTSSVLKIADPRCVLRALWKNSQIGQTKNHLVQIVGHRGQVVRIEYHCGQTARYHPLYPLLIEKVRNGLATEPNHKPILQQVNNPPVQAILTEEKTIKSGSPIYQQNKIAQKYGIQQIDLVSKLPVSYHTQRVPLKLLYTLQQITYPPLILEDQPPEVPVDEASPSSSWSFGALLPSPPHSDVTPEFSDAPAAESEASLDSSASFGARLPSPPHSDVTPEFSDAPAAESEASLDSSASFGARLPSPPHSDVTPEFSDAPAAEREASLDSSASFGARLPSPPHSDVTPSSKISSESVPQYSSPNPRIQGIPRSVLEALPTSNIPQSKVIDDWLKLIHKSPEPIRSPIKILQFGDENVGELFSPASKLSSVGIYEGSLSLSPAPRKLMGVQQLGSTNSNQRGPLSSRLNNLNVRV